MNCECAWCGFPLGPRPPLEDVRTTHGICGPCGERLLNESASVLIIVSAAHDALFESLRQALRETAGVRVIRDRRVGNRRRQAVARETERRRQPSRRAPVGPREHDAWAALGVQVVWRGRRDTAPSRVEASRTARHANGL